MPVWPKGDDFPVDDSACGQMLQSLGDGAETSIQHLLPARIKRNFFFAPNCLKPVPIEL